MSYGKFAPKMKINNSYNPYMSESWNLGASVGNLLGTLWGANYLQRGQKRTIEEAQKIADQYMNNPAPDSLYQDYTGINISPIDQQTAKDSGVDTTNNSIANQPAGINIGDASSLSKLTFKQDYIGKYKDDPNAVGNGIAGRSIADVVNGNLKNLNTNQMPAFSAKNASAAIEAQLIREGKRSPEMIAAAMKFINPQLQAKEEEYNKNKSDELYELYKASNGKDMNALANIAKINPALAKFAYDDFVYNRNRQDKLADMETARKEALAREERAFARQQALLSQRLAHDAQKEQSKVKTLKDVVDGNIDYGSKEYKQMVSDYIRINAKEDKTDDDVKRLAALEKKINSVSDSAVPLPTSPEDKQAWVAQVFADGKKEGIGVKELKNYLLSQVPQYSQDYFALQKSIDAVINDPDFY